MWVFQGKYLWWPEIVIFACFVCFWSKLWWQFALSSDCCEEWSDGMQLIAKLIKINLIAKLTFNQLNYLNYLTFVYCQINVFIFEGNQKRRTVALNERIAWIQSTFAKRWSYKRKHVLLLMFCFRPKEIAAIEIVHNLTIYWINIWFLCVDKNTKSW